METNEPKKFNVASDRPTTSQQEAAFLGENKRWFDPVAAENDLENALTNGGISWEELLQELDEVDRQDVPAKPM